MFLRWHGEAVMFVVDVVHVTVDVLDSVNRCFTSGAFAAVDSFTMYFVLRCSVKTPWRGDYFNFDVAIPVHMVRY